MPDGKPSEKFPKTLGEMFSMDGVVYILDHSRYVTDLTLM